MLNERILKPNNETCLKCEHQIKQTTNSREKKMQVTTDRKIVESDYMLQFL